MEITKTAVYFTYVDDTLALFEGKIESKKYLVKIKGKHSTVKYTSKKEKNRCLAFLDVYSMLNIPKRVLKPVSTANQRFNANAYAGNFFDGQNAKTSLILIVVHCALKICYKYKFFIATH